MANVNVPPFTEAPSTVVGGTSTTDFPFDFPFWESADILVYIDGELLDADDYTVTGYYVQDEEAVEGGYGSGLVELDTGVTNCTVTIDRNVAGNRQTQFSRSSPLGMPALNSDLNRLTARQQDLDRHKMGRPSGDRAGKFVAFDADGNEVASSGTGADAGLREDLVAATGGSLVANQRTAGDNLRPQSFSEFIEGGVVMPSQFDGTADQRFRRALTEAGTSRDNGLGQTVLLPRGRLELDAHFNCPDRVSVIGVNKRGSVIRPSASWNSATSPYMATVVNGDVSMFDNALERLTLDCNHVDGLGGLSADAWQEGGGFERVLIEKFTTNGVLIANGHGGAAHCAMREFEIMGSNQIKATCGILFDQVSSVGAFILNLNNGTITGSPHPELEVDDGSFWLDYGIKVVNDSLISHAVHFECTTSGVYLDGDGHHILHGLTGADTVTNVIEIASTFEGTYEIKGCRRWGATNLIKDNRTGAGSLGTIAFDGDFASGPIGGIGQLIAYGNFNGTDPALTYVQGCSGIVRDGDGEWTVTLSTPVPSANHITVNVTSNHVGGRARASLATVSTFKIFDETFGGTPTDASEINFQVWRCR